MQFMSCKCMFGFIFLCVIQRIISHVKTVVLPPPKWFLKQNTKMTSGDWFSLNFCLRLPSQGEGCSVTICFH